MLSCTEITFLEVVQRLVPSLHSRKILRPSSEPGAQDQAPWLPPTVQRHTCWANRWFSGGCMPDQLWVSLRWACDRLVTHHSWDRLLLTCYPELDTPQRGAELI